MSKYPPLIPVPDPSDTSIDGTKSNLTYSTELITIVHNNHRREEVLSSDLYGQLPEMNQEHQEDQRFSDSSFAAIGPSEIFHLQPRADVHSNAPEIAGSTSGLMTRDRVYQQTPTSIAGASQLLLLPILASWFKSAREAFQVRSGGSSRRQRKRAISSGARPLRKHARSWNVSHDVLNQGSLD